VTPKEIEMNRILSIAAATIVGGVVLLSVGACQENIRGSGVAAGRSLPAAQSQLTDEVSGDSTGRNEGSDGGGTATTEQTAVTAGQSADPSAPPLAGPPVTRSKGESTTTTSGAQTPQSPDNSGDDTGTTTAADHSSSRDKTPGQHQIPAPRIKSASVSCEYADSDRAYHEFLSYEVVNATGMALSIDNPGIVGSYGTYDWHGTIEIPNLGCYLVNGEQIYTLYTVGGTGPQASKTITRTGTHTAITPPPFSTPTTKAPMPTHPASSAPSVLTSSPMSPATTA